MGKNKGIYGVLAFLLMVRPGAAPAVASRARPPAIQGGQDVEQFRQSWRVLEPIVRRNLAVYPVVSTFKVDTSDFLTLDEGLASGAVKIVERGQVENALYRRRDWRRWPERPEEWPGAGGASVNELVLLNNSSRPLILLAGEVVSGGKQNRIIGADLIVPPKSDPLPLTVFCVEHGRWSAGSGFGAARAIAHPEIRKEAQMNKSQAGVWESVTRAAGTLRAASPTSDYMQVLNSPAAKPAVDKVARSIEAEYEKELREQLRGQGAVGVVVSINGELIWSDVFSSADLFGKYWPKLLRSYVMEAEGRGRAGKEAPSPKQAAAFLLEDRGRASIKVEPGAYRRAEISAGDYQIVALEALGKSEDTALLVHYNKMARD